MRSPTDASPSPPYECQRTARGRCGSLPFSTVVDFPLLLFAGFDRRTESLELSTSRSVFVITVIGNDGRAAALRASTDRRFCHNRYREYEPAIHAPVTGCCLLFSITVIGTAREGGITGWRRRCAAPDAAPSTRPAGARHNFWNLTGWRAILAMHQSFGIIGP